MAVLIDHFESRLGRMEGAWSPPAHAVNGSPQVGCFRGGLLAPAQFFATIGLHRTGLTAPAPGGHLHLELIIGDYPQDGGAGPLPDVLDWVADRVVAGGRAVSRGDVIPLPIPLGPGGRMTALYAAAPVYFDDDFASALIENGTTVFVVWLLPVGAGEAAFITNRGREAFEQELVRQDPDLLDLGRPHLTLEEPDASSKHTQSRTPDRHR